MPAAAVAVVLASVVLLSLFDGSAGSSARLSADSGAGLAPDFTLTDVYGHNFTLSDYRNHSVVLIDFTSLSCSECQIIEKSLKSIYASYNQSGSSPVVIVSVFIEPQYGDTVSAVRAYQQQQNISWVLARDTPNLAVKTAYGVVDIPTIVVVNKAGYATYDDSGAQTTQQLQTALTSAVSGHPAPVSIVAVSVFALAALAGLATFFSPCAFPMFPGYMSLFLGLNVASAPSAEPGRGGRYGGALKRGLSAGSASALGMIIVFLTIGVALSLAATTIENRIPDFLVVVGIALVVLGGLLLTNLQYWRIVAPFQALGRRLRGRPAGEVAVVPAQGGKGLHLKLFGYGMGYAAAAAGCVAPVILASIAAGLTLGWVGGLVNIAIYSLTAALLMVVATVLIAVTGKKYVNQLKAYTPVIKKVTAVALVAVGIYLVYFYYLAWGF